MTNEITITKELQQQINTKKSVLESRLKINGIDRTFEDYANDIMYAVSKEPKLQSCTASSIVDSAFQLAKCGLSIGSNIGWLVPFGSACQFQIGYEGYSLLLNRIAGIKHKIYECVYKDDAFEYIPTKKGVDENGDFYAKASFSMNAGKEHKEIIGAYAFISLKDGNSFIKYMNLEEIKKYKPKSSSGMFWGTWDDIMYSKQVYKILARELLKFYCNTNQNVSQDIIDVVAEDENREIKNVAPIEAKATINSSDFETEAEDENIAAEALKKGETSDNLL